MTSYMQIAKLDFALGGCIVGDGYPLPPLVDMVGKHREEAIKNASYYGHDMRFMIWEGTEDPIFPSKTMNEFTSIFNVLNVSDTWKINHTEQGMGHVVPQEEMDQAWRFTNGLNLDDITPGPGPSPKPPTPSPGKDVKAEYKV